jgi:hypothetical protein
MSIVLHEERHWRRGSSQNVSLLCRTCPPLTVAKLSALRSRLTSSLGPKTLVKLRERPEKDHGPCRTSQGENQFNDPVASEVMKQGVPSVKPDFPQSNRGVTPKGLHFTKRGHWSDWVNRPELPSDNGLGSFCRWVVDDTCTNPPHRNNIDDGISARVFAKAHAMIKFRPCQSHVGLSTSSSRGLRSLPLLKIY